LSSRLFLLRLASFHICLTQQSVILKLKICRWVCYIYVGCSNYIALFPRVFAHAKVWTSIFQGTTQNWRQNKTQRPGTETWSCTLLLIKTHPSPQVLSISTTTGRLPVIVSVEYDLLIAGLILRSLSLHENNINIHLAWFLLFRVEEKTIPDSYCWESRATPIRQRRVKLVIKGESSGIEQPHNSRTDEFRLDTEQEGTITKYGIRYIGERIGAKLEKLFERH